MNKKDSALDEIGNAIVPYKTVTDGKIDNGQYVELSIVLYWKKLAKEALGIK